MHNEKKKVPILKKSERERRRRIKKRNLTFVIILAIRFVVEEITKLLNEVIDRKNYVAYETNITNISSVLSNKFTLKNSTYFIIIKKIIMEINR